jgi:hypothetical protein
VTGEWVWSDDEEVVSSQDEVPAAFKSAQNPRLLFVFIKTMLNLFQNYFYLSQVKAIHFKIGENIFCPFFLLIQAVKNLF